jgi:hypothetical protein
MWKLISPNETNYCYREACFISQYKNNFSYYEISVADQSKANQASIKLLTRDQNTIHICINPVARMYDYTRNRDGTVFVSNTFTGAASGDGS